MNIFVKLVLLTSLIYHITECKPQTKPIISDDCQVFRSHCSDLCFKEVENDQCWGSPRYVQCVCTDGFIHLIPGYECKHPDCPKDVVKDGTTRKPIQRKRKPILRRKQPQRTSDTNTKPMTMPIIPDECQDFRSQCSQVCFNAVENDQCWGSPKYRQCKCNDGMTHLIPGYDCEHPECKSCALDLGFGSCKQPEKEENEE